MISILQEWVGHADGVLFFFGAEKARRHARHGYVIGVF
jgi:hypothetical protein